MSCSCGWTFPWMCLVSVGLAFIRKNEKKRISTRFKFKESTFRFKPEKFSRKANICDLILAQNYVEKTGFPYSISYVRSVKTGYINGIIFNPDGTMESYVAKNGILPEYIELIIKNQNGTITKKEFKQLRKMLY